MAKNEQLDLARWATDRAVKAGALEARVSVSRTHSTSVEYRDRKVETLEESTESGLGLALYAEGRYSSHRTSDLRKDAIESFIGEAVAMTRHLTEDPHRGLPDPELYTGRSEIDLGLSDPDYGSTTPESRHRLAQTVEGAALELGGKKIISITAGASEYRYEAAMVASNGFEGVEERTNFWAGAEATAKDAGDKRPAEWWYEGRRQRGRLGDPADIGRRAVTRALERVGSDKIETAELPMVVENRAMGRLLRFLGSALDGSSLQQKRSFLEGYLDKPIASEHLTLIDDPLVHQGQGSRLFDEEGITARRLPIIEGGVLRNFYIDTYYGRKLDMAPTTGGLSNLVVESDAIKRVQDWMSDLDRGILVTGFLGGNSNSATGDFSTGIQGFLFEKGRIVRPVSEMNIAGNHLEFWNKLLGIGDDPYEFSSLRTPSFVFDATVIAGA